MSRVFLTGATGMIGSNIAEQLVEQGDAVRALVREGSETGPLEAFGVEVVRGDITDPDAVPAADGCEYVVHSARCSAARRRSPASTRPSTLVGTGPCSTPRRRSAPRVVQLSTTTFFDAQKRAAHRALAARSGPERRPVHGHEARRLPRRHAPGGGRRPGHLHRDLGRRVRHARRCPSARWCAAAATTPVTVAVRGRPVRHRASVVATPQGRGGGAVPRRSARPGDVGGVPYFCNAALEIAGSDRRVTEVAVAELDDPDVAARFGPSLVALARKHFPSRRSS